jgi:hypothetical protein
MLEVSAGKNRSLPGQGHGSKYPSKILDRFIGSLAERIIGTMYIALPLNEIGVLLG